MDEPQRQAGLMRRLAALFYDSILLTALLMLATALLMPLIGGAIEPGRFWYLAYLILVVCAYFAFFWLRQGQTLGMQSWKIRLSRADGAPLRLADVLRRLLSAAVAMLPLGAGLFWMLIDRDRLAWQDRLSNTRLILV